MHTFRHRRRSQPLKAEASSSEAVMVSCLAQGQLDTQLGGAGDRTSNLTSQPALPLELISVGYFLKQNVQAKVTKQVMLFCWNPNHYVSLYQGAGQWPKQAFL